MNKFDSTFLAMRETTASQTNAQIPTPQIRTITSPGGLSGTSAVGHRVGTLDNPTVSVWAYSIRAAKNAEAAEVFSSVMVDEMLHLTLAANLLKLWGDD